jgi:branched-chain amino acid transport system ATP-binding protein
MTLLEVHGLSKKFGGVQALSAIDFKVEKGAIHAVIGPNGAGKTTLFNLISGLYVPSSGTIKMQGNDVTGLSPLGLAQCGLSRTFQNLQICMNLAAVENVMVGGHLALNASLLASILRLKTMRRADEELRARSCELMEFVGVAKYIGAPASQMPYGALKRLEIARALAANPKLLLLDEPAAGLNNTETAEIEDVIKKIAEEGITVMLVEHDMKLVMNISNHLLVLDFGKKLAEGTGDEVRRNPDVIAAYLGVQA